MRSIQIHNHPFKFLLYLEWVLLAIAILTELIPPPFPRVHHFPLPTIVSIISFGVIGLRLPTGSLVDKIVYTAIEFLLILSTGITRIRAIRLFPLLYLILVIRSCLIFGLPGRLAVASLSFTLFLMTLMRRYNRISAPPLLQERLRFVPLSFGLLFGLSLVFVLLLMNAIISERQSREKLAIANDQLRQYALRIEDQATLQERTRIAREIHDSLGHSLTALNLQLETALKLWQSNPTKAQTFLSQAKNLASLALQEVRQSVSTMRSDPLQGRSLSLAIAMAQDFHRSTGILPTYHVQLTDPIPTDVSTAIYRIVQEALTNISTYASATQIKIQLIATSTNLELTVQDNGRGFNLDQNTTGFGLQTMRDRTIALGGNFNINSTFGQGCTITANIPLPMLSQ